MAGLGKALTKALGRDCLAAEAAFGELNLRVPREAVIRVMEALKSAFEFQQLVDLCGVDYPQRAERFDVAYHLLSMTRNQRIRVLVSADETNPVPSITGVFPNADWFEREAFDLYGIGFSGHPDLRRILTDYGFVGHPLRKDFPMTGYVECRWDETQKRVVYEPVKLPQEFRNFDFLSPWEGAEYARGSGVLPGDEKAQGVK
ncbi:NADH-quinone oxidoreductase subunit C [Brevundimonas sp. 2R-24]|uniref:NADH-quinone oxidoreductase subunit C n=1 Tax=Peiella sedimenti TaxID=3061083 RepID=A0ABT8SM80_9CAUL|nr:NADH-quinone oxidoreductase subunit C [Caulobacteraceae bacterium XZ-24]